MRRAAPAFRDQHAFAADPSNPPHTTCPLPPSLPPSLPPFLCRPAGGTGTGTRLPMAPVTSPWSARGVLGTTGHAPDAATGGQRLARARQTTLGTQTPTWAWETQTLVAVEWWTEDVGGRPLSSRPLLDDQVRVCGVVCVMQACRVAWDEVCLGVGGGVCGVWCV